MDGKPHDSLIEGWWREEGIIQAPDYVCVCVCDWRLPRVRNVDHCNCSSLCLTKTDRK